MSRGSRIYADGILISGTPRGARIYADGVYMGQEVVPTVTLTTTKNGLFSATVEGSGFLTFDYSEGSPQTLELTSGGVVFSHTYSTADEKEIKITGALFGVTYFSASSTELTNDIAEFAKFTSLKVLSIGNTGVTGDIAALTGMPLTSLYLYSTSVTGDIAALTGMLLKALYLSNTGATGDIAALIGMPLVTLHLGNTGVTGDIAALTGMPLTTLYLYGTNVGCNGTAISALTGCNIQLQNCSWVDDGGDGNETDNYLIVAAAAGHSGCSINIGGNNVARTSASDAALGALIAAGNMPIDVNE